MARFDRPRYDYRGVEYDRRYGRYEGADARRAALEAWRHEPHGPRGRRPPTGSGRSGRGRSDWRVETDWDAARSYDNDYMMVDRAYSRRWWPWAMRRSHRGY